MTLAEIEEMVRYAVASIPARSDPAAYTKFVVDSAISRYDTDGLEATVDHYSRFGSVDGQWYVFIIDADDTVIAHYNPDLVGLDVKGPVGTDINGYNYGPEMLAATEAGRWVPYVYVNPVQRHPRRRRCVRAQERLGHPPRRAAVRLRLVHQHRRVRARSSSQSRPNTSASAGSRRSWSSTTTPKAISAGLIPTAQYYNATNTLDGFFSGFIATPDGEILAHIDPSLIGTQIEDLLGPAVHNATQTASGSPPRTTRPSGPTPCASGSSTWTAPSSAPAGTSPRPTEHRLRSAQQSRRGRARHAHV